MARKRQLAGELLLAGIRVAKVAEIFEVHRMSVYRWKDMVEEGGLPALLPTKAPGRPRRLKPEQLRKLKGTLLNTEPEAYGFPGTTWSGSNIRRLVKHLFHVTYDLDHCL